MQKKQLVMKLIKGQKETLELASVVSDYYFKKFSRRLFGEADTEESDSDIEIAKVIKSGKELLLLDPILSDAERIEIQSLPDSDLIKLLRDVNIQFLRLDKSLSSTNQL